jgi:hypothetical protein
VEAEDERRMLRALLGAIEDRARAGALPDDAQALRVARRHRLTPLLSIRCRGHLPPGLEAACRRDHLVNTAQHLALAATAEECVAALAAAGVQATLIKGLAYERGLYGEPGARPTSDVDLLVRGEDRRAAFSVLDGLGFQPRAAAPGFDEPDYHEVAWRREKVEVDLHLALAPLARCAIDYGEVWRDVQPTTLGATGAFLLSPPHAAVFHALHMAIDHFDVPALYLLDLTRLLPARAEVELALATARRWRCLRPLTTSLALAAAFVPRFGAGPPLPRPEQLLRKLAHFDGPAFALRYTVVQARRNLRERTAAKRSPRARLNLPPP